MMLKKISLILLSLVLCLSLICGCEAPSEIGTDTTESTEQTTEGQVESTQEDETTTATEDETENNGSISILQGSEYTLEVGESVRLTIYKSPSITNTVGWFAEGQIVDVDENGLVTALSAGDATVTAFVGNVSDSILIHVVEKETETTESVTTAETEDSTESVETEERGELEKRPVDEIFEAVNSPSGYTPAGSYEDALNRSQNGLSLCARPSSDNLRISADEGWQAHQKQRFILP